jgi:hypothetical protein
MSKFPLRMSIAVAACCALAGCPPFGTPVVVDPPSDAIPPTSGPNPVGGVLEPGSSTLLLTDCVRGDPFGPSDIGSKSYNFSVSASGGVTATLFQLVGISLNANTTKTVTVSADGITGQGLTSSYRNVDTGGRCDLSNIKNPRYVRIAYKAKSIKYTLNAQAGAGAQADVCKAVANIGAGASANIKANYTNQLQYTSSSDVFFAVLQNSVPSGWRDNVDLHAEAKSIKPAYPYSYVVRGPDAGNNYTLTVYGPNAPSPLVFNVMNADQQTIINGIPFLVRIYHSSSDRSQLVIQFAQYGLQTASTSGNSASGGAPTAGGVVASTTGGTTTTTGGTTTTTPQTGSPCPPASTS